MDVAAMCIRPPTHPTTRLPDMINPSGGITPESAGKYLDAGASHVIVTSYLFQGATVRSTRGEKGRRTGKLCMCMSMCMYMCIYGWIDGWMDAHHRTLED
jgi:hypothetical protein